MNDLTIFQSEQFGTVRTLDEDNKILFCGTDVAKALGYSRTNEAITRHCRYTLKRSTPHPQSPDKTIEMLFITEGDLYRLITHSRLPAAEAFEKWVFDEVLPTIRKTGQYGKPEPATLPITSRELSPIRIDESKARQNWLNYMLSALERKIGLTKDEMLHSCYKTMKSEGLDIDEIKARYIENTGRINASTFEALCNDRVSATELADILHSNMKISFIQRCLKY